jgi:hypothetical protein
VVRLKSNVLEVWSRVKNLPEAEREDELSEHVGDVQRWDVETTDEDELTEEEKKVKEYFNAEYKKNMISTKKQQINSPDAEEKKGEEDEKEEDEEDEATDDGWWWQLLMQRDEPTGDTPAMKLNLFGGPRCADKKESYDGTWWLTGIELADSEGVQAMSLMADYLAADL